MAIRLIGCANSQRKDAATPAMSFIKCKKAQTLDWKPMPTIGPSVREIRIRDVSGAYRVIYIATLPDAVHVLHAFQKKTRKTARRDLAIAFERLRELKRGSAG
jgi:phage-related protein